MNKPKVYIAGPITHGTLPSVKDACHVWRRLLDWGFHPICPHWSIIQELVAPVDYETYLEYDFETIDGCAAVLRMTGASKGADREVEYAGTKGIPVFFMGEDNSTLPQEIFKLLPKGTR